MAITLEANYAKKLGLPNFSSHQYSVTVRTELNDLSQIEQESTRLYRLLQDAVDREIQEVGFMPDATQYGMNPPTNGNHGTTNGARREGDWQCSDKQRELIEKIVRENSLDKNAVEEMAKEMFGSGVKQLNRLQASGLIDELLERHGGTRRGRGDGNGKENGNGNGNGYSRRRDRRAFTRGAAE